MGGDTAPAMASSRAALDAGDESKKKRSTRRRRGIFSRTRQVITKHTYVLPAVLIALFLAAYAVNPNESNPVHRFIFPSYKLEGVFNDNGEVQYGKGKWDIAFVCFAILGPWGLYVMSKTPVWYFNTRGMYEQFPHTTHSALVKFYYLFQAAYWAQQAIVLMLGLEKPRKDFKELIGHHIVTLSLIALSYRFHFTYIGIAVYITHDISDFFLATSKTLNYLDSPITPPFTASSSSSGY